jgi:hypothetical protein
MVELTSGHQGEDEESSILEITSGHQGEGEDL